MSSISVPSSSPEQADSDPALLSPAPPPQRSDQTREALIHAAIRVFGDQGFSASSTRALAEKAGVNPALIVYHFGSKQGLYLAVFEHIASCFKHKTSRQLEALEKRLQTAENPLTPKQREEYYLPPLLQLCDSLLDIMLGDETEHWAKLIVREQQQPTAAFSVLYEGFMGRVLKLQTQLICRLRPDESEEEARVLVLSIIGQILVWRVCRAAVQQHLQCASPGTTEAARIRQRLHRNLKAMILAETGIED